MEFSVSICVYGKDNADHFKTAMESIINQTIPPTEIVLVVDGPIPERIQKVTQDIQSKCEYLKVVYLKNNVGHGEARRTGIDQCTHNLIAIMDADDICVPDRFEQQLLCFRTEAGLSVVGGNIVEFVDDINNTVGIRKVPEDDSGIKQYLKKRCPFNQVTVMFKKDDVMEAGGYIDWYCEEDYYLWIRMM
jgi:glycosyltransferase involved in cell wall biosynthesis